MNDLDILRAAPRKYLPKNAGNGQRHEGNQWSSCDTKSRQAFGFRRRTPFMGQRSAMAGTYALASAVQCSVSTDGGFKSASSSPAHADSDDKGIPSLETLPLRKTCQKYHSKVHGNNQRILQGLTMTIGQSNGADVLVGLHPVSTILQNKHSKSYLNPIDVLRPVKGRALTPRKTVCLGGVKPPSSVSLPKINDARFPKMSTRFFLEQCSSIKEFTRQARSPTHQPTCTKSNKQDIRALSRHHLGSLPSRSCMMVFISEALPKKEVPQNLRL